MDAAEYKHLVLGLIFVKYISDTFQSRREELTRRFADPKDYYFLPDADAELLAEELEDRDYYREVNVFWVPARPVMCSVKFTNISLACSPVQKASVADSSTRQQASLKRWLLCWLRIMARYMTRVVVLAVCLCSLSVLSKPTVASLAMSASTARKPTPPHGDWRQ
jgi:hypothetical protein